MKRLALFTAITIMMVSGAVAAPATDTRLEKQTFTDKIISSLSSFSLTSDDAGNFVAGEKVHLKATYTINSVEYNYDAFGLKTNKLYGGDIFLKIKSPSGKTVHLEKIKDYSSSTYVLEGKSYNWEGNWKIPNDIGGQSGDYEFTIFEAMQLTSKDEKVFLTYSGFTGQMLCDSYGDFNQNSVCYDIVSTKESNTYDIQTGGEENNPPSANVKWEGGDFDVGGTATWSANAQDNSGIRSIKWYIDGEYYSEFDGQQEIQYSFEEPGEHSITVKVTDIDGVTVEDTQNVNADAPENEEPSVEIKGAENSYSAGESVDLRAEASDPDGSIESIEWSIDGRTSEDVSFTFQEAGEHTVSVTVKDNNGATASDSVTLTVESANTEKVWVSPADSSSCIKAPANSAGGNSYDTQEECVNAQSGDNNNNDNNSNKTRWIVNNGNCIKTTSSNSIDTSYDTEKQCKNNITEKIFGINKNAAIIGGAVGGAILFLMMFGGTVIAIIMS